MADESPKSAFELAMERLRRKDAEAGVEERPLTEAAKAAIAEARNVCEARLAEIRILHQSRLAGITEPEARAKSEEEYRRDVQRTRDDCDRKIAKIRAGVAG